MPTYAYLSFLQNLDIHHDRDYQQNSYTSIILTLVKHNNMRYDKPCEDQLNKIPTGTR